MRTPRPSASERPPVCGIYHSSLGVTTTVVVSVSAGSATKELKYIKRYVIIKEK
jgi:hypothetical protein